MLMLIVQIESYLKYATCSSYPGQARIMNWNLTITDLKKHGNISQH